MNLGSGLVWYGADYTAKNKRRYIQVYPCVSYTYLPYTIGKNIPVQLFNQEARL